MRVLCLEKRYANFKYGKIYNAEAHATKGLGKYKQPAVFKIIDEDGDYYTIADTKDKLEKNWEWVE